MSTERAGRLWLLYATATTLLWGVWGAFIEAPEKAGFPATLSYVVWALTTVPCALVALRTAGWKVDRDRRSVLLGATVGFTGAGGQVILFEALRTGPAYIVFPIVSLYPVLTVALATWILKERARRRVWIGIVLALFAIGMLSYQPPGSTAARGYLWLALAIGVFFAWGLQAFVMKLANVTMTAESVFFYMSGTALALIPAAAFMTDFSRPINWGWNGPYLAAGVQVLNSIGALCLVYAVRYGKAIVVVPMTSLAPMLTVVLSLALYHVVPNPVVAAGLALAGLAIYLMAE